VAYNTSHKTSQQSDISPPTSSPSHIQESPCPRRYTTTPLAEHSYCGDKSPYLQTWVIVHPAGAIGLHRTYLVAPSAVRGGGGSQPAWGPCPLPTMLHTAWPWGIRFRKEIGGRRIGGVSAVGTPAILVIKCLWHKQEFITIGVCNPHTTIMWLAVH